MLKYKVLDMRTREPLGFVTGATADECYQKAKEEYETSERKFIAYPIQITEHPVVEECQVDEECSHPTYLQQLLLSNAEYQQLIDTRYTSEQFGFEPGKALVLNMKHAEAALTDWVRRFFKLDTNYVARIRVATDDDGHADYVVVVSEKPNGSG